jgi:hypothetical protein
MSKLTTSLFVTSSLVLAGMLTVQAFAQSSKDAYEAAKKSSDAQYKIDKEACAPLSANAKDVCIAQAKGKDSVAKADAKAAHENTPKAREGARVARGQADYDVAKEKCDDLAGNPKDVCVKEAKAALVKVKSDAKVERVAAETKKDGAEKRTEARSDATAAKRDANYKVALEKCDVLSGESKDACVRNAKVQFGKT